VLKFAAFYRHVVDECAVEAFQIFDNEVLRLSLNLGVAAGDRGVRNAKRSRSFAADDDRQVFKGKDVALKSSRDGCESRVHPSGVGS